MRFPVVIVGVSSLVRSSSFKRPLSLDDNRSSVGRPGAVVSIVTVRLGESALSFPAISFTSALKICAASVKLFSVNVWEVLPTPSSILPSVSELSITRKTESISESVNEPIVIRKSSVAVPKLVVLSSSSNPVS